LVSKASLHLCVVTQLFFDGEHCNRASSRSFTEAPCGGAFGQSSRRSKSSPSRPEFELSDKQFRLDFINAGCCRSWRAPAAGRLAVDLPLPSLLAGFHPSGLLQSSWTSRASNDDQTFQAGCNDGSVKASASANVRLATIKLALRLSNIPRLVGKHDNIVPLDPRFVDTGGGAKRRGVFR